MQQVAATTVRSSKVMGCFARKWKAIATALIACAAAAQTLRPPLPAFTLEDPHGQRITFPAQSGKVMVVIFVSTRCPISNAFNFRINELYNSYKDKVRFVVLDSNVNESAREIQAHAKEMEYDFPVYRDIQNKAADLIGAKATPDSFVIDKTGRISYHGYIEDAPNPQRSKDHALKLAMEAALNDQPAPEAETHARGCAIRRTADESTI